MQRTLALAIMLAVSTAPALAQKAGKGGIGIDEIGRAHV